VLTAVVVTVLAFTDDADTKLVFSVLNVAKFVNTVAVDVESVNVDEACVYLLTVTVLKEISCGITNTGG
jgi:hypothetical protein